MALTTADLLAIREQQLTIQVLQEGNLDSRINELKGVLADIQAFQDLDTAKKDLADLKLTLDKQQEDLYNKGIDLDNINNNNIQSNKEEKDKLIKLLNSVKDREGALASAVAALGDKEKAFSEYQAGVEQDLSSRLESVSVTEGLLNKKQADLQLREEALVRKLEVLKGI